MDNKIEYNPAMATLKVAQEGAIEVVGSKYRLRGLLGAIFNLLGFAVCVTILILTLGGCSVIGEIGF